MNLPVLSHTDPAPRIEEPKLTFEPKLVQNCQLLEWKRLVNPSQAKKEVKVSRGEGGPEGQRDLRPGPARTIPVALGQISVASYRDTFLDMDPVRVALVQNARNGSIYKKVSRYEATEIWSSPTGMTLSTRWSTRVSLGRLSPVT